MRLDDQIRCLFGESTRVESGNDFGQQNSSEDDLVTVVVPSYNHQDYVREAVESIVGQGYSNLEIILIDDHSQDQTFDVAFDVLKASHRPFLAIQKQTNHGLVYNLNAGVMLSNGSWIGVLASDDIYYCNKISASIHAAKAKGDDVDVVIATADEISKDGKIVARIPLDEAVFSLSDEELRKKYLNRDLRFPGQAQLLSKRAFLKVGLWNRSVYVEDCEFAIRICSSGLRKVFINQAVAAHRQTRPILTNSLIDKGKYSFLAVTRMYSRSQREYREASCKIYLEAALNKMHHQGLLNCLGDAWNGFITSPFGAGRYLMKRFLSRLR